MEERITITIPKSVADSLYNLLHDSMQDMHHNIRECRANGGEDDANEVQYQLDNLEIVYGLLAQRNISGETECQY